MSNYLVVSADGHAGPPADVWTGMGATFYTGVLCALFWTTAAVDGEVGAANAFIVTGAALLGLRFLYRFRRVV